MAKDWPTPVSLWTTDVRWFCAVLMCLWAGVSCGGPEVTLKGNPDDTSWFRRDGLLSKPSDSHVVVDRAVSGAAYLHFRCNPAGEVQGRIEFPLVPWSKEPIRVRIDGGPWLVVTGGAIEPGQTVQLVADGKTMQVHTKGRPELVWTLEDVNCGVRWLQGQCAAPDSQPAAAP